MGYLLLAAVAAAGLLASASCHVMGWLNLEPPWGKSVFFLHVGIFVVWIPLVLFANRTMPKTGRGNFEHLFKVLPKWVRVATYGLFVYALLNFAYFILLACQYPRRGIPFSVELRGFSGHWMLFYGLAVVGFVALARLTRKRKTNEIIA